VDAREVRRIILRQAHLAHVGHIGSALSIADILAALFSGPLADQDPDDPDRHRLVLSKGHAALALYAVLHLRGVLSQEQLDTYCQDGSLLGVHPEQALRGVDFSTGSLGQGLSLAAGSALAAHLSGSQRRVFALLSDAECNEGSTWEAMAFAAHHRLGNLVAIVDDNGQQALGHTREVLDLSPLSERWRAFGWETSDVDGHDVGALRAAISRDGDRPRVIVARTLAGKGVSFMEGQVKWHYWPLSDTEYAQALAELGAA
jgi:transketolase